MQKRTESRREKGDGRYGRRASEQELGSRITGVHLIKEGCRCQYTQLDKGVAIPLFPAAAAAAAHLSLAVGPGPAIHNTASSSKAASKEKCGIE